MIFLLVTCFLFMINCEKECVGEEEQENILLTGGAGFIGHHIIKHFLEKTRYNIVCLDRLDESGDQNRLAEVLDDLPEQRHRLKMVWHDLKNPITDIVGQEIKHYGELHYVFHLAAGSHVDRSIDFPMEFVMDNVVGTVTLLNFLRDSCNDTLKQILYFSTDEVFGPAYEIPYKEDDRYNAGNPYAAAKAGGEEMAMAFQNTYKMPIIVTHTMNVFGVRQHPEKFIPLVINRVRDQEMVFIHADPSCTRAGSRVYIHTDDVAEAMHFLMKKGVVGEKYNIVGPTEVDNLTLARLIAKCVGKELLYELVDFHSSRPGHDLRYALDGSKMEAMGWKSHKSLEERIQEVVEWTLQNDEWLGKKEQK